MKNNLHTNLLCFAGAFIAKTAYDTWYKSNFARANNISSEHSAITFGYKLATKICLLPVAHTYLSNSIQSKAWRYALVSGAFTSISLAVSDQISSYFSGNTETKSFHFTLYGWNGKHHKFTGLQTDNFSLLRDVIAKTVGLAVQKGLEPSPLSATNPIHYFAAFGAFTLGHLTTSLCSLRFGEFGRHGAGKYGKAFIKPATKSVLKGLTSYIFSLSDDLAETTSESLVSL